MINVLLNVYAVSPKWGSEPGLGWNWIVNLSKYCNVFVITEGEWKEDIEREICKLPQKDNIHIYYNPVSSKVREMCWNQGDWRFYKYYRLWQEKTLLIARDIVSKYHIDIIHQLNMIGFREPGSLWKIEGIPFIWGPIGGYGWTTLSYLKGQPLQVKFKAIFKNILNILQGKLYPLPRYAMMHASCVMAANSKVYKYIKKNFRDDVILLNETGCYVNYDQMEKEENDIFNILWVGKFDYRKQLELAINTLSYLVQENPNVKLNIVGDNNNESYRRILLLCEKLQLNQNIVWHGKIPNNKVHALMQKSNIFLFTSIDEGTPHVVLESIQNRLPVVCFDTCGQGDIVNDSVGVKIPLGNTTSSSLLFAREISNLMNNPQRLIAMSKNCFQRQKELSWDTKIRDVLNIYNNILDSAH